MRPKYLISLDNPNRATFAFNITDMEDNLNKETWKEMGWNYFDTLEDAIQFWVNNMRKPSFLFDHNTNDVTNFDMPKDDIKKILEIWEKYKDLL